MDGSFIREVGTGKVVVFIHGLWGSSDQTWLNSSNKAYWPTLLSQDERFDQFSIYVLDYRTGYSRDDIPVEDLAGQLCRCWEDGDLNSYSSIHFVAHSLGGIVLRRALKRTHDKVGSDLFHLFQNAVFLSTPTLGTPLANIAAVFLRMQPQLAVLRTLSNTLDMINTDWSTLLLQRRREGQRYPLVFGAYETKPTIDLGIIVGHDNCLTVFDETPEPFDRDHLEIAKPKDRSDGAYGWCARRLLGLSWPTPGERRATRVEPPRPLDLQSQQIRYADEGRELIEDVQLRAFPRNATPDVLTTQSGWFEYVAGPGQGKTWYAFQLVKNALQLDRGVYWYDARSSLGELAWPGLDGFQSGSLILVDNAHYLELGNLRKLADSKPADVSIVFLGRLPKLTEVLDPDAFRTIELSADDLRTFILNRPSDSPDVLQRIADEAADWVEAVELLDDLEETAAGLNECGSVAEFLSYKTNERLRDDELLRNYALQACAVFNFIDLKIEASEINERIEREFASVLGHGWIRSQSERLHPNYAERILRAMDLLDPLTQGAPLGRIAGEVLSGSLAPPEQIEERIKEVRRHTRYGQLLDCEKFLPSFFDTLLEAQAQIPLDLIHTERGSEFRRQGQLTNAEQELEKVKKDRRGPLWRYEMAYVHFMKGSKEDLDAASENLRADLMGELDEDAFMNRGLYAKVLARKGILQQAFDLLEFLYRSGLPGRPGDDARRWAFSVAAHRHEFGVGLAAHGTPVDVKMLYRELDDACKRLKDPKPTLSYNETLQAAINRNRNAMRDKAEEGLAKLEQKVTGSDEQKASYLALLGAAIEARGDWRIALEKYNEILTLRPELDNRRGIAWAKARLGDLQAPEDASDLLLAVLRTLFPLAAS